MHPTPVEIPTTSAMALSDEPVYSTLTTVQGEKRSLVLDDDEEEGERTAKITCSERNAIKLSEIRSTVC